MLKAVVENLDDVPENLREEYKEVDGKFYLDLDDNTLRIHTSVTPLANALATLKTEKKTLSEKLSGALTKLNGLPDDFAAQTYLDLVQELETLKKDPGHDKERAEQLQQLRDGLQKRIAEAEAKRVADLAEKDAVIVLKDGIIEGLVAGDGLQKALIAHNVGPQYLKAATALLRPHVKMEVDEDTNERSAVVDTDMGRLPVDKFVENWAKSDEGKPFVVKPTGSGALGSGSGNGRSSEPNPWDPKYNNYTQQGAIIRADRAKARRLMAAAGIPEHKINATLG